ncbi:MAG: UDP-2,3-diacylglucosamine diphosphatase [Bacteroidia bacterium]
MLIRSNIYFLSDFHLGVPTREKSLEREKRIVRFLNQIKDDAKEIYIMGDVFDFWFEYKTVVPKGYTRLLGTIAHLADSGIPIHLFTGNHDMWSFTYFQEELGVKLYKEPILKEIDGKKFFLGHGDGLGPGDKGYKLIKKIFANPFCQWLFARLHPNFGIGLANYFSRKSRMANAEADEIFLGENEEWLIQFCKEYLLKNPPVDYFIFGHRHLPLDISLDKGARYINLGEWVKYNSYAVFDGKNVELKYFEKE